MKRRNTLFILIFSLALVFLHKENVFADMSYRDKVTVNNLSRCYNISGLFKYTTEVKPSKAKSYKNILDDTGMVTNANGETQSCKDFIGGLGNVSSLSGADLLLTLGYTQDQNSSSGGCFSIVTKEDNNGNNSFSEKSSNKVCVLDDELTVTNSSNEGSVRIKKASGNKVKVCVTQTVQGGGGNYDQGTSKECASTEETYEYNGSVENLLAEINNDLRADLPDSTNTIGGTHIQFTATDQAVTSYDDTSELTYSLGKVTNDTVATVANKILGTSISPDDHAHLGTTLSEEEEYQLLDDYLSSVYGVGSNTTQCDVDSSPGDDYAQVKLVQGGEVKTCYVKAQNDKTIYVDGTAYDFNGTVNRMNELADASDFNLEALAAVSEVPSTDAVGDSDTSQSSDATCEDVGDTSLTWIICPTVDTMAEGTDGMYSVIRDFLDIDPELVSGNFSTSPAYQMWTYFRSLSNILLIVILLVIIFSQLTGYGIDNYGIKRMLPRLIAAGILINISYYLCQIAVDISNIVGRNISLWLSSMARTIQSDIGTSAEIGFGAVFTAIIGILAGGGSLAGTVGIGTLTTVVTSGLAASFPLLIIPLLIALVIALVSVMIFFLMLGARQIVVMLAVALSPLAIVSYILPNTEKLFKKWLDILKGMLLIYPICGALYGVSQLVKALAYSAEGIHLWMVIVALLSSFLPFLAAPTLVKKSFNALGDVGAKINGLGDRIRRTGRNAQESYKKSEFYKSSNDRAMVRSAEMRNEHLRELQNSGKGDSIRAKALSIGAGARNAQAAAANRRMITRERATNPDFLETTFAAQANEEEIRAQDDYITRIEQGGIVDENGNDKYARGTNNGAMLQDAIRIFNQGDNASNEQKIQAAALMRRIAVNKDGRKFLGDMVYNRNEDGVDEDGKAVLTDAGLRAFNAQRLKSRDIKDTMQQKFTVTSAYLNALASADANEAERNRYLDMSRDSSNLNSIAEEFLNYNSADLARGRDGSGSDGLLSDDSAIASQSGGELKRYVNYLKTAHVGNLIASPNYNNLMTDADARAALESHKDYEKAVIEYQTQEEQMRGFAQREAIFADMKASALNDARGTHGVDVTVTKPDGTKETRHEMVYRVPLREGVFKDGSGWRYDAETGHTVHEEKGTNNGVSGTYRFDGTTGDVSFIDDTAPTEPAS